MKSVMEAWPRSSRPPPRRRCAYLTAWTGGKPIAGRILSASPPHNALRLSNKMADSQGLFDFESRPGSCKLWESLRSITSRHTHPKATIMNRNVIVTANPAGKDIVAPTFTASDFAVIFENHKRAADQTAILKPIRRLDLFESEPSSMGIPRQPSRNAPSGPCSRTSCSRCTAPVHLQWSKRTVIFVRKPSTCSRATTIRHAGRRTPPAALVMDRKLLRLLLPGVVIPSISDRFDTVAVMLELCHIKRWVRP